MPLPGGSAALLLESCEPTAGHEPLSVYGDAAYGAGKLLDTLEQAGADINCKAQPPAAAGGLFTKDAFDIDLRVGSVRCLAGRAAPLRPSGQGKIASFGAACATCPLTGPAPASVTRTGPPATGRPDPRLNAKSTT